MTQACLPTANTWASLAAVAKLDPILVAIAQGARRPYTAGDECCQRWRLYEIVLAAALTEQPHPDCGLKGVGVCSLSCGVIDELGLQRLGTAKKYLRQQYDLPVGCDWDDFSGPDVTISKRQVPLQPLERAPG